MVFSKQHEDITISVNGEAVEQVSTFQYLGTIVTSGNYDIKREIRSRIEKARQAFWNMKNFFTGSELNIDLRMRMIRCYVFSTLLYGEVTNIEV